MTFTQKVLLTLSISFTVFALFLVSNYPPKSVEGSVSQGSEYIATTTKSAVLGVSLNTPQTLITGSCTLGSVVITGKNTGTINIYDGTSTIQHSDYATSTLAVFPSNTPEGTYTFDARCVRGIVVESSGLIATSTITFR